MKQIKGSIVHILKQLFIKTARIVPLVALLAKEHLSVYYSWRVR